MPGIAPATRAISIRFLPIALVLGLVGCAATQMRYNVLTYDDAIADSANELLLLNAVRASQRYPMSFTSVGQVVAGPPVSGSLQGTMNFSNPIGLTTSSFTPNFSNISPGYSQFALDNLNNRDFMEAIRKRIPDAITDSFATSNWPSALVHLIFTLQLHPSDAMVSSIDRQRKATCRNPGNERDRGLCAVLDAEIATFASRCSEHFSDGQVRMRQFREDRQIYYNTASTYCHFARFHIFLNEMRLLHMSTCRGKNPPSGCMRATQRSALQMIQYLGELVAAQHYIETPFTPYILIGRSAAQGGFDWVEVPLFVVKRGVGDLERPAIIVRHEGEIFYIPRPDFGSRTEARSLQALDLVLQTVRAATHREDMPKVPSFGIITK